MVETAAEIKVLLPVTDPKIWAEATAGNIGYHSTL